VKDLFRSINSARISQGAVLNRDSSLKSFPRSGAVLFIERETASWIILEGKELQFFQRLNRPVTRDQAFEIGKSLDFSVEESDDFLSTLYLQGMIQVNGKAYYRPESLWEHCRSYPSFLCLHPTDRCNFACSYCLARADATRENMPLSTGLKVVRRLINEFPQKDICVDFHGGEPLLVFDNVAAIIEESAVLGRERKKNVTFRIQSNGALLNGEMVEFLKSYKVSLGFSIDGPEQIHDRFRVFPDGRGTFRQVWDNFRMARDKGLSPGALAVVHEPSSYLDVFRFFTGEGLHSFRVNFSSFIGRAGENLEFPVTRAEEFATEYLRMVDEAYQHARKNDVKLRINDISYQIGNLISRRRPFMCDRSPCGIGRSILGFGTDGGIYGCEESAGLGEFRVGHIDDDIPLTDVVDKNEVMQGLYDRTVENIPKCRNCTWKYFCGGGCTSKTYAWFGTVMRESPMCRFYQKVYYELMWKIYDEPDMVKYLGNLS